MMTIMGDPRRSSAYTNEFGRIFTLPQSEYVGAAAPVWGTPSENAYILMQRDRGVSRDQVAQDIAQQNFERDQAVQRRLDELKLMPVPVAPEVQQGVIPGRPVGSSANMRIMSPQERYAAEYGNPSANRAQHESNLVGAGMAPGPYTATGSVQERERRYQNYLKIQNDAAAKAEDARRFNEQNDTARYAADRGVESAYGQGALAAGIKGFWDSRRPGMTEAPRPMVAPPGSVVTDARGGVLFDNRGDSSGKPQYEGPIKVVNGREMYFDGKSYVPILDKQGGSKPLDPFVLQGYTEWVDSAPNVEVKVQRQKLLDDYIRSSLSGGAAPAGAAQSPVAPAPAAPAQNQSPVISPEDARRELERRRAARAASGVK